MQRGGGCGRGEHEAVLVPVQDVVQLEEGDTGRPALAVGEGEHRREQLEVDGDGDTGDVADHGQQHLRVVQLVGRHVDRRQEHADRVGLRVRGHAHPQRFPRGRPPVPHLQGLDGQVVLHEVAREGQAVDVVVIDWVIVSVIDQDVVDELVIPAAAAPRGGCGRPMRWRWSPHEEGMHGVDQQRPRHRARLQPFEDVGGTESVGRFLTIPGGCKIDRHNTSSRKAAHGQRGSFFVFGRGKTRVG